MTTLTRPMSVQDDELAEAELAAALLIALSQGPADSVALARHVKQPVGRVLHALQPLAGHGIVHLESAGRWCLGARLEKPSRDSF